MSALALWGFSWALSGGTCSRLGNGMDERRVYGGWRWDEKGWMEGMEKHMGWKERGFTEDGYENEHRGGEEMKAIGRGIEQVDVGVLDIEMK